MFYWYGIDWTYLVLVLPAMIFALIAQGMVTSTFNKYAKKATRCGMTGYQAANMILEENGIHDVRIERISGNLNDHFDPKAGVIRLSDATYASTSAAAVGVAAHEAGHAVQHAEGYLPIKIRSKLVPITNFASRGTWILILLGAIFYYSDFGYMLVMVGIGLFAVTTLFQLVTLPCEFDASNRAMRELRECGWYTGSELAASRRVLSAAALTYVASLLVSVLQLLRLVVRYSRR